MPTPSKRSSYAHEYQAQHRLEQHMVALRLDALASIERPLVEHSHHMDASRIRQLITDARGQMLNHYASVLVAPMVSANARVTVDTESDRYALALNALRALNRVHELNHSYMHISMPGFLAREHRAADHLDRAMAELAITSVAPTKLPDPGDDMPGQIAIQRLRDLETVDEMFAALMFARYEERPSQHRQAISETTFGGLYAQLNQMRLSLESEALRIGLLAASSAVRARVIDCSYSSYAREGASVVHLSERMSRHPGMWQRDDEATLRASLQNGIAQLRDRLA
jgi:hypothetical protein